MIHTLIWTLFWLAVAVLAAVPFVTARINRSDDERNRLFDGEADAEQATDPAIWGHSVTGQEQAVANLNEEASHAG